MVEDVLRICPAAVVVRVAMIGAAGRGAGLAIAFVYDSAATPCTF